MDDPAILWGDEHLLAADKPAGLATLPDGWDPSAPFLLDLLQNQYGRLWVVHRLDRETSGVIVFARSAQAHRVMNRFFAERSVAKVYHALVFGAPGWETRAVSLPLRVDVGHKHRTVIDHQNGKPALTDIKVIKKMGAFCLVEASPHTGRTHQIRVHLSAIGHPIAGDPLYSDLSTINSMSNIMEYADRCEIAHGFSRTMLHAYSISFHHPITDQPLTFTAPYPPDFAEGIKNLINDTV